MNALGSLSIPEKSAALFRKAACFLMVGAFLVFSVRFDWKRLATETGSIGILSSAPKLGFYLALASLVCAIVWFVLAVGFKNRDSEHKDTTAPNRQTE